MSAEVQKQAADLFFKKSPASYELPGYINPKELPKLTRLQRIINKKVTR